MDPFFTREHLLQMQENGYKFPNEQFLEYSPTELMKIQRIDSLFFYSKLFISKLYVYSITNQIHLPFLTRDLISLSKGEKTRMKPPSLLLRNPELKKHNLMHMHYFYTEALVKNYTNELRKPIENNELNVTPPHENKYDFKSYFDAFWKHLNLKIEQKDFLTGEWLIFKECDGNKYFLDITPHGSDQYIIDAIENIYKHEFPDIFKFA